MEQEEIIKCVVSFKEFCKNIARASFKQEGYIEPNHLYHWAELMQQNNRMSLLAPRMHLKSTIIYFYLMWRILRCQNKNEKWFYFSYKQSLSVYHLKNIKQLIRDNPYFNELKELTDAEGTIKYSWDGKHTFEVEPMGILAFKRGVHGNVILDDILADPTEQLDPKIVRKITNIFFEQIWFIPAPEENIYLVGTPQHLTDLFFEIKDKKDMNWFKFTAIIDRYNKKVLWKERFSWDYLIDLEKKRPNSFKKEMMCEPVWSTDTFIDKDKLYKCVVNQLPKIEIEKQNIIGAIDIGKHTHPSHIFILAEEKGKLITVYERWLDGWEYFKQVELINYLINEYKVDKFYYDNTRGEFEGFKETKQLSNKTIPINFNIKTKHSMAGALQEYINLEKVILPNNQRTINQILAVNNNLDAYETTEGHGDSFQSLAMCCMGFEELKNIIKPRLKFG